jgi:hypothetical protein
MTRFFSFFEGAGSSTGGGATGAGGAGAMTGGGGASTTGAGAAGCGLGQQPDAHTVAMTKDKHIRKIICFFMEITAVI